MASQLTEFHYHLTQGGKANLFNFEEKNFDIKDIYNYYLRKVSLKWNVKDSAISVNSLRFLKSLI